MTLNEMFINNQGPIGMWASVVCSDGTIFEGLVVSEAPYGVYLSIGGDPERLSLFPWGKLDRVVYKKV